jgi:hypothetical protein
LKNSLFNRKLIINVLIFLLVISNSPLINGESNLFKKQLSITDNEYELIIITSSKFQESLTPFVEHKNNLGIDTTCITCRDIYNGKYFNVEGRDDAEKVKYFIKSAIEEWNIKYVILAGGRKGGILQPKWWVPARYSHVYPWYEEYFLSDLYFADIYDAEGNFSTWDTNENDIFGEWNNDGKDILDMYPDVCLGRLPFKNNNEVDIMVSKIITYETTAHGSDWFKKCIGIAGDTWADENDYYEGEMITEAAFSYLENFEKIFLWTSTGAFTCKQDVVDAVSLGCGFLVFSGHSDPMTWCTYPPHGEEWIEAPDVFEMDQIINGDKMPITLVGGCNSAQFDISIFNIIKGIFEMGIRYFFDYPGIPKGYYEYDWGYRSWSWGLATKSDMGSIAVMGNTGLGYEEKNEECLTEYNGYLIQQFFKFYSEGEDILGEIFNLQIMNYMDTFPPMENKDDCKVVQEWILLGDPSLKIGGY